MAHKKKLEEKPAEAFIVEPKHEEQVVKIEEPKDNKKDQSEIDDYEDNWDMSDHDL